MSKLILTLTLNVYFMKYCYVDDLSFGTFGLVLYVLHIDILPGFKISVESKKLKNISYFYINSSPLISNLTR